MDRSLNGICGWAFSGKPGAVGSVFFVLGLLLTTSAVLAQPLEVVWTDRHVGRTPTVQAGIEIENLSNGRYRASVTAVADPDWDAYVDYQIVNPSAGVVYEVTADFAPIVVGGEITAQSNLASLGPRLLGAGETVVGQTERFKPAEFGSSLYEPVHELPARAPMSCTATCTTRPWTACGTRGWCTSPRPLA